MSNSEKTADEEAGLPDKYHQLQASYYQLEDDHFALQHQFKRVRRRYRIFFLVLLIAGLGLGGYFWRGEIASSFPGSPAQAQKEENSQENIVTIKQQTLRNTLSLTGKIEPRGQMDVVAPLEGMVLEKNFQYGEFVAKDTLLLTLDASYEKAKYRKAQATYLEAEATLKSLQQWEESLDVIGKRYELKKKQNELKTTQRELKKTRRLLEKGIVASSELEKLEEEYRNQNDDIAYAKKQLALTLEKGSLDNVRLEELKRENALFEMEALAARIEQARLVSPIAGVLLLPVSRSKEDPLEVQTGTFVKQDQVLFTLADLEGFIIRAQVDENDILKLQLGQEVTITGDAFQDDLTLKGTVQYISFQADQEEPGKASSFSARIAINSPTEEQKKRLLLGMSADMEVLLSEKENAIIIPFAYVTVDDKEQAWVRKVLEENGESKKVPVKIGVTEANTVEILEGLEVGDKIMQEPLPSSL
jgi:multidrug efflux pump subunit AcrA (membrane-fusion protein)